MKTTQPRERVERFVEARVEIRAESEALPPGVCGRITAIALTFDTVDTYGTAFAPGCAARTIGQRVNSRKVPFLMDHEREVGSHVGVVASMSQVGGGYVMVADLFDTDEGRSALAYAKAVAAADAATGVSIGFIPRRSELATLEGQTVERYLEIELREISLTPMPAVSGATVIGARRDAGLALVRDDATLLSVAARAALDAMSAEARTNLLALYAAPPDAPATASSPAETRSATAPAPLASSVPIDERLRIARSTFGTPLP